MPVTDRMVTRHVYGVASFSGDISFGVILQILKYRQATTGKKGEALVKALQTCYRY